MRELNLMRWLSHQNRPHKGIALGELAAPTYMPGAIEEVIKTLENNAHDVLPHIPK